MTESDYRNLTLSIHYRYIYYCILLPSVPVSRDAELHQLHQFLIELSARQRSRTVRTLTIVIL